jgi:hypothetical protein
MSPDNVRIMERIMRYDDACNMYGTGVYRNFGTKYSKEKLHSQDNF